jgi:hypothetical protein
MSSKREKRSPVRGGRFELMFGFLRRSGIRGLSPAIRRALEADGLSAADVSRLGVVESPGTFSGRKATFIRVFDPKRAVGRPINASSEHAYEDLNAHLDLVLRAGFVERDGTVVIYSRAPGLDAPVPRRVPADRSAHRGDERFVFPGKSRSENE